MLGGSLEFTPTTVAAFILFIGILIFVHELGHFLFAKYFNIKVLKFSLGFGKPLLSFTRGETTYQIAMFPLGGFVKMLGELPSDEIAPEDRNRAFNTVPVYQRALVAFAGPLFNLIFPVMCFFAYYLLGPTVVSPIVGQVSLNSPAQGAGLQSGDRIVSVDGTQIWGFEHLVDVVQDAAGEQLRFVIERGDKKIEQTIVPREVEGRDVFGGAKKRGIIGVTRARTEQTRVGVTVPGRGFATGDKILRVGDTTVRTLADADVAIARAAGKRVDVHISRPAPHQVGGLFLLDRSEPTTVTIAVPEGAGGIDAVGLASAETFIRGLERDGAAFRAGLRPGDQILAVAGEPVSIFYSFVEKLMQAKKTPTEVKVRRLGEELSLSIVNDERKITNEVTQEEEPYFDAGLGIGEAPRRQLTVQWNGGGKYMTEETKLSLGQALVSSVQQTVKIISMTTLGVVKLLSGGVSYKAVSGPIMIFQVAAVAAERGIFAYLEFLAVISINLGIVNLLPIPIFDGGQLMFCAIEAIQRKPISLRVREAATLVGLAIIAALIVLVFTNDISRLAGGM